MAKEQGLRYIGGGFLPGVPARDLDSAEVEQFGGAKKLIKSGLYEPVTQTAAKPATKDGDSWQLAM